MVAGLLDQKMRERGLNQYQLAKRAHLSQGHVSKLLSGEFTLPRRGTRDKIGAVLGLNEADWFRAAGVLPEEGDTEPPPEINYAAIQLPLEEPDQDFDADAIVRFVESKPGPRFQLQLQQQRDRLSRADYVRFCVGLFRAWSSNANLAFTTAEMMAPGG